MINWKKRILVGLKISEMVHCMGCEVISSFSNGNNISESWDMGSLLEL